VAEWSATRPECVLGISQTLFELPLLSMAEPGMADKAQNPRFGSRRLLTLPITISSPYNETFSCKEYP
jgi:hypothetical protein